MGAYQVVSAPVCPVQTSEQIITTTYIVNYSFDIFHVIQLPFVSDIQHSIWADDPGYQGHPQRVKGRTMLPPGSAAEKG